MKTRTFWILSTTFIGFLGCFTAIFAHVVDLEFVNPADRYSVDPDKEGRDFFEWVNEQNRKEDARDQWVKDLVNDVAFEVAASFDPRLGERD